MKKIIIILFVIVSMSACSFTSPSSETGLSKKEYIKSFDQKNAEFALLKLDFSQETVNMDEVNKALAILHEMKDLKGPSHLEKKESRIDATLDAYSETIENITKVENTDKNQHIDRLNELTVALSRNYTAYRR